MCSLRESFQATFAERIFLAKATICVLLIPNMSRSAADGPERGKPFTASLWTEIEASAETAAHTASPIPPSTKINLEFQLLNCIIYEIAISCLTRTLKIIKSTL